MTGLDLFCGAGGASLGLVAAGVDLVAAYDHDAAACRAHRALLPGCPVRERAALQALPWVPELRGKATGNAVPPPLASAVVRSVLSADAALRGAA